MNLLQRRRFLLRGLALGATLPLGACNYEDPQHPDLADDFLHAMSYWNDRVQAAIFSPNTLAPVFRPDQITRPPRVNAVYDISQAPAVDESSYRLQLGGQIQDKVPWSLAALNALPQEQQITRLICVEGWRVIGQWGGVRLSDFLRRIGADTSCKYVSFKCADGYYSSIDMESALHPQTILATSFLGQPLTPAFGAPLRLRIPTKLGFKNPKNLIYLGVGNVYTGGYWEDQGYNWFSGS
jgi:DMSO/TMAO reductase YedYZ molybdopterin-dependent catalytic subunit